MITTYAQNNSPKIGSISGIVTDNLTKEPIPYATVSIHNNNELITGGITTESGNFELKKIPLGSFTVKVQFIGYEDVVQNITLTRNNKSQNIGNISLKEGAEQLDAIEVIAERSTVEQKIDRKVINIGKDLVSAGATATEIMNNIQSVSVDQQTGAIALRGNNNVRVLVDGKPTNIDPSQLLQQIPSSSIKQIELITNPSAKYNPEGMSGIINIVLHKNSNMGFNGNISTGLTFGITPKLNSSLGLNYKVGKVNIYGNYGFNTGKNQNHGFKDSYQENLENRSNFDFGTDNTSHLIKTGIDYYINDKNTLSFYTTQNLFYSDTFGRTELLFSDPSNGNVLQINNSETDSHSQTYNVDYKVDFGKEGQNLELEVNYNVTDAPQDAFFNLNNTPREDVIGNKRDNLLINLDYVRPFSETTKLELGLESRTQNTENNLLSTGQNLDGSFTYDREIYSAYVTLSKKWNEKWSAQFGTRLESYNIDAVFTGYDAVADATTTEKLTDDIFSIYPSAFVTYNQNEKNSFNLSYSRRVDRPSIGQVNPIREWTTPSVDSEGNPNLQPQFTNSFELNYTRKIKLGSLTTGVFYRNINDEINRSVSIHPTITNKLILTHENFDDNNAFGFEASANLRFAKWWNTNASFDIYHKTVKGVVSSESTTSGFEDVEIDNTSFNTRINNNFKATKKLRFQLSGFYSAPDLGLQFQRNEMWKIDAGASYNVFKGKGTVSARVSDIFNSMNFSFEGSKPYRQEGEFNWESQSVYIGFNYRFGGGKNRALQRKRRDNNEKRSSGGMM
ncbi:TonB-dependent receptor domain-containing protein [Pseudofulvibacter geojedonensis]|uniref:TonB-dependent receptor domain-containing protein n=1 Tax=Pseudofulvibacter geojedonensis TaxID=1123758 RepID=A0ABW3HZR3_9FLAO